MSDPQVFLTTIESGKIVICNERGEVFDGQTQVTARNAVDEVDTVTVTMAHGGWVDAETHEDGLNVPEPPPPANPDAPKPAPPPSTRRKESEG